eukprot:scaffold34925_cov150-Amphora_coffeaeformis.AAC.1
MSFGSCFSCLHARVPSHFTRDLSADVKPHKKLLLFSLSNISGGPPALLLYRLRNSAHCCLPSIGSQGCRRSAKLGRKASVRRQGSRKAGIGGSKGRTASCTTGAASQ